jgi:chitinase domain-containing protein 1
MVFEYSWQNFMVYKIPSFHLQKIGQALLPLPGDAKSQPALATATQFAATQTSAPAEAATAQATTE